MSRKEFPRCSATNKDGTRCFVSVSDGSRPPVCHIHRAAQSGAGLGAVQPQPFNALEKLRKIAATDGNPGQLQALKVLIEIERDEQPSAPDLNLGLLTDAERAEITAACKSIVRIKAILAERQRTYVPPVEEPEEEPEPQAVEEPEPEPARPVAAPEPEPVDPEPYPLPRSQWAAAGITEVNGVPTTDFGDEHALKILNLEIPYEDAVRDHAASEEHAKDFSAALRKQRESEGAY